MTTSSYLTTLSRRSACCALLALAGSVLACGYRTPGQRAQDYARSITPDRIKATRGTSATVPPTAMRVVTLRIWVEQEYRRRPNWKRHVSTVIARANAVVAAQFGLRFEVDEVREWQRKADGGNLGELLMEVEGKDSGADVDWVVGFTTAISAMRSAQHLGMARTMGRHFVIRDMTDLSEHRALEEGLHLLSEKERQAVYSKRLAHKEVVVFLHEWGHVLGALHMRDREWLMNPAYDHEATAFSPFNRELLEIGIRHHLANQEVKGPVDQSPWRAEIVRHTKAHPEARVDPDDREAVLAGGTGGGRGPIGLSSQDLQAFNDVVTEVNAGRVAAAWTRVEPLMREHRDNGTVMSLACHVASKGARPAPAAYDLCNVASMVDGASPASLLTMARIDLANADSEKAVAHLTGADERLRSQIRPDGASALELAGLWLQVGELTLAERALSLVPPSTPRDEMAAAVLQSRRQWGLPPGAQPAEPGNREYAYVAAMRSAYDALRTGNSAGAARQAASLAKTYPDAAGPLAISCAARLGQRRVREADALCRKALGQYDESVLAVFMLAQVALAHKDTTRAIDHLERVVELAPDYSAAWLELGKLYRRRGDEPALRDLESAYLTQFGSALPGRQ